MQLRGLLLGIARNYDRLLPSDSSQEFFDAASDVILPHLPVDYSVASRHRMGNRAAVPLIAIFDSPGKKSTRTGLYVVYHFAADMQCIMLSLAQGTDEVTELRGFAQGCRQLAANAAAIRRALRTDSIAGLSSTIKLRSPLPRPRSYEASVICSRVYAVDQLPAETKLLSDLMRFIRIYQEARATKEGGSST